MVIKRTRKKSTWKNLAERKRLHRAPYVQVDWDGRQALDPAIVIEYVARFGLPQPKKTIQERIEYVRNLLEHDITLLKDLEANTRHYPAWTDALLEQEIKKSEQTKYKTRKSPRFSANLFCNIEMIGNDKQSYESIPNKKDICVWKLINNTK